MTTHISLLRGINVGGNKKIKMEALKGLYESLGFKNVKTYIQSGNVIFSTAEKNPEKLSKKIEAAIAQEFGFEVTVIIRTPTQFAALIKKTPYSKQEEKKRHVIFLSHSPKNPIFDKIDAIKIGDEDYKLIDTELYLYLPNGSGTSKLSNNLFEKCLNVSGTTRNWNTVQKLFELANEV